ncbi:MAG TPA: translational GTPase TypA, partial [Rhizobiales bacterium]|nr:translational GTPase TypA [Hyphomicrobiales bacterium]
SYERHAWAVNEVFDLFAALDASDEQLDFPILYGSAKEGWMAAAPEGPKDGMGPLFDMVLAHVPSPPVKEGAFSMLATTLEADPFLGRILTGRITSGTIAPNASIKALNREGQEVERGRITKLLSFDGLERRGVEAASAGDIIAIAGLSKATVSDTLCDMSVEAALAAEPVDPPTLAMTFRINDGPLAGQEGSKVQSRVIRERLMREAEGNVALTITDTGEKDSFDVAGRGELQLAILIETMRREGFELTVSRPQVVMKTDPDTGEKLEPVEEVFIDVNEEYSGVVVKKLNQRKAELMEMKPSSGGRQILRFLAPTRGLIGYLGELLTDTRGTGIMNRVFHAYAPYKGAIQGRRTGVLISNSQGNAVAFALWNLEDRGPLMIEPGTRVYEGMIVGGHTRGNDLEVNVLKGKKLTNIRAAGRDDAVSLTTPLILTLEKALAFVQDDELVEITPKSIRLRKRHLDPHERKRAERAAAS